MNSVTDEAIEDEESDEFLTDEESDDGKEADVDVGDLVKNLLRRSSLIVKGLRKNENKMDKNAQVLSQVITGKSSNNKL